jgi:hypothetical protein
MKKLKDDIKRKNENKVNKFKNNQKLLLKEEKEKFKKLMMDFE